MIQINKFKIILTILSFVIILFLQNLFYIGIQPEVSNDLALDQFAKPTLEKGTVQRAFGENLFNFVWIAYVTFISILFVPDFVKLIKPKEEK